MLNLHTKKHRTFSMLDVNPCFRTKKVLQHIANLIIDYDYTTYYDLSEGDRRELAALLIDAAGKDGEYECLVECKDSDQIIAALKLALTNSSNDDALIDTIKDAAVDYYDDIMHALFDGVYDDYCQERNEWLDRMAKDGDPDEAYERYLCNLSL